MSTITVHNNTKLPIHLATQWDNIVQEFKNNVQPGQTVDLPAADFGWQDFMVIIGTNANEISHDNDWRAALNLSAQIFGTLATAASIMLIPISGGSFAVVAASIASATAATFSTVASAATAIGANPVAVAGLWGPDGYDMSITGGDTTAEKQGDQLVVKIAPLCVTWVNKVSKTSGVASSTR